jgi:hypothetical protein
MRYFAYGADMRGGAMDELLGHRAEGTRALLRGYRLAFTAYSDDWEGGVADLIRDEAGEVEGVLFDLSPTDELRIGFAEGLGESTFRRRRLRVELEDGTEVEALAREAARKGAFVAPSHAFLDAMVSGAMEQGLSQTYINFLMQLYPDEPTVHSRSWRDEE